MSAKVGLVRLISVLSVLLATACWAEVGLDRVVSVRQSVRGDTLRVVLETESREPRASAYFLSGPDRLVVELDGAVPAARLPAQPATRMVSSWSLTQSGLNRARLTVNLDYRPPQSEIKLLTLTSPPRVAVDIPTQPGVREEMALTPGITWIREDTFLAGRWTRLNRLLFDPADPNLEVVLGLAHEKTNARETLSSMVRRYGAVAGINGGFFAGGGGPLGLVYRDGRMLAPHVSRRPPRSGFGLTREGKALFGRIAAAGERIKDLDGGDWSRAWLALGGGPRLLQNGLAHITTDLEELGPKGNDITRVAARTVVGLTGSDQLLFATVSGYRDNHREGAQFGPLVGWLKGLGVKEAVNFDGGASVDMVIGSHIVSDGPANTTKEKPVATALLVKDSRPTLFAERALWSFTETSLPADGESTSEVSVTLTRASGEAVPDGTPVRFFAHGLRVEPAFTSTTAGVARTIIHATRNPGSSKIALTAGPLSDSKPFSLLSGRVEQILIAQASAGRAPGKAGTQKVILKVQAVDRWGNGIAGERLLSSVDGVAGPEFVTGGQGMLSLEVDLPVEGGRFTVHHSSGDVTHRVAPLPAP